MQSGTLGFLYCEPIVGLYNRLAVMLCHCCGFQWLSLGHIFDVCQSGKNCAEIAIISISPVLKSLLAYKELMDNLPCFGLVGMFVSSIPGTLMLI